jgi:hypothetical protein
MTSEARPRQHRIVNPEHAIACLRRLVAAWERGCLLHPQVAADKRAEFLGALREAERLLDQRASEGTAHADV